MRILYITPAFQHPTVRGPHRHYHFIRALSKRHQITLLTLVRSHVRLEARQEMERCTESILTFDVNGASDSDLANWIEGLPVIGSKLGEKIKLWHGLRQMRAAFRSLVNQDSFDVVLFHGKSVFEVIRDWRGLPLVVDFCDASSMRIRSRMKVAGISKQPLLWYRFLRMRQIERDLVAKTPHIAFISNRDQAAVVGPQSDFEIIPIGVDHKYWTRSTPAYKPNTIVFTGVMDYGPNHDSAMYLLDRIVPLVRQHVPDLEIIIAGRDPLPELIQKAESVGGVTVTGFVDDMRSYLEQAAVFAAPMRFGSGIQNKVLEAMAMELPVVTTTVVADGLKLKNGQPPVRVGDTDESFATSLMDLLKNSAERDRLAGESRGL